MKFIGKENKIISDQLLNENEETLKMISYLLDVDVKAERFMGRQAVNGKTLMSSFNSSTGLDEFLRII